jgi:YfiR/HmsC-like
VYRRANNSTKKPPSGQVRMTAWGFGLLCIVLLVLGVSRSAQGQSAADEYDVKAAFLFHFAQLTDWPAGALDAGDPSLKLCILDDEPSRQELQNTIDGKVVGGRVLHVRQISQLQEIRDCNILFLSRDEAQRQTAIVRSLRGMPVLTVGETANFLSEGGMIRFHLEEGKVRFDINLTAADSSHLKISSRLLLLATSVTRGAKADGGE